MRTTAAESRRFAYHDDGSVPPPPIAITAATSADRDEVLHALDRLLPALAPSAPPLGPAEVAELLAGPGTTVWVARDEGRVVGAITLVVFRTPTGLRANIESLVVDPAARGRGIGEALCRAALARAGQVGADTVDLTSAPARQAANRLYLRLGFERRDTNVYRYRPPRRA
jgi:ribosomal protein S18 acetylase RimI-like enzyme